MVKLLVLFVIAHLVSLLELAGATCVVVGLGCWFGTPAVLVSAGVFALGKAFELDLSSGGS